MQGCPLMQRAGAATVGAGRIIRLDPEFDALVSKGCETRESRHGLHLHGGSVCGSLPARRDFDAPVLSVRNPGQHCSILKVSCEWRVSLKIVLLPSGPVIHPDVFKRLRETVV